MSHSRDGRRSSALGLLHEDRGKEGEEKDDASSCVERGLRITRVSTLAKLTGQGQEQRSKYSHGSEFDEEQKAIKQEMEKTRSPRTVDTRRARRSSL